MLRIGVLCGDYWHPAETVKQGLLPLADDHLQFDWIEHASEWSIAWMERFDVIILAKSNEISATDATPWLTEEVQTAFVDHVEKGKGLLFLHSGTVGYLDQPRFLQLAGGVFRSHPEACPVTLTSLEDPADRFVVHDEHYWMEMSGEAVEVYLTSSSSHGTQPAGWRREQGKGRVCVLTPGHFLAVWQQPEYLDKIKQAILWCAPH